MNWRRFSPALLQVVAGGGCRPCTAGGEAIIALGHRLGIRIAADGVESEWQKRFLRQAGCDLAQGNHLAPPLAADAVTARLAAQQAVARQGIDRAG
ncbi:MAG TPA: EAL domain-containing protein [Gammaproteobacteria bacterium]|nr:EAL domain-containing protein [Gammaproteobacteria bacterium]